VNQKFDMDGYNDVSARIVEFREKHPDGSLQPADLDKPFQVLEVGDQMFIVVVAAAFRSPDDEKPGVGMAYEQFPGRTPYTKGSELQNAETSAWGRAIVAALAADTKKGIASAEEVRNRQAERDQPQSDEDKRTELRGQVANVGKAKGLGTEKTRAMFVERMQKDVSVAGVAELAEFRDWLRQWKPPVEETVASP
jgi:hypothetical protein